MALVRARDLPSHGSGSVLAARWSMEKATSTPFSNLDSGSAFINQYCFCELEETPLGSSLGPTAGLAAFVAFAFLADDVC